MKGHVRKRGDTWTAVISLGRDPVTGKRKQRWSGGHKTRAAAERVARELIASLEEGTLVAPSKATVGEYLAEWLDGLAVQGLRDSTRLSYRTILESLVVPRVGAVRLQALSALHLNSLYSELLERGRKNGGRLSLTTVKYTHTVIRKALQDAVAASLLIRNVADQARPPREEARGTAMRTWSPEQLRRFLAHVRDDRLFPTFLLLAATGMRRGEALGLRWADVDLERGSLAIRQTLIAPRHSQVVFSEPKTKRSKRNIDLDEETVAVLREHRKQQLEERLAFGAGYEENDLCFRQPDGSPIHPASFSERFQAETRRTGLPVIRLHDLRHTWASLALAAGVHPKVVSERLGHSSVAITLDTYSHVAPGMQRDAAQLVAGLFLG